MKTNRLSNHLYLKGCFLGLILLLPLLISAQSTDLVVVDQDFGQKELLASKLSTNNVQLLELTSSENPWKSIRTTLVQNPAIETIHLFAEGSFDHIKLGTIVYDTAQVDAESELSMLEGVYKGTNIQMLVYNCSIGANEQGRQLLKKIGDKAYFNISVPTDCNTIFSEDLTFNYTSLGQATSQPILQN